MKSIVDMMEAKVGEIEDAPTLPIGNYICKINRTEAVESKNGEWDLLNVHSQVVEACEDVDPDELEEYGKVAGARLIYTIFSPRDEDAENDRARALKRMEQFTDMCGVAEDGMTLSQAWAELAGAQFMATVEHQFNRDDAEAPPRAVISRVAAVE